jgi:hypothetical protein
VPPLPQWKKSYLDLYKITKRATPKIFCNYKMALSLYKVFNDKFPCNEWLHSNFNLINISQKTTFMTSKLNNLKLGMNCLANRFNHINGKIPLLWLNKSYNCYKIECKKMLLNFLNKFLSDNVLCTNTVFLLIFLPSLHILNVWLIILNCNFKLPWNILLFNSIISLNEHQKFPTSFSIWHFIVACHCHIQLLTYF